MEHLNNNYLIVKSNALISARHSLNVTEGRIVLSMISLIEPHDEDFNEYELSVKDILDISGLHNSKDEYGRVKEALHSLLSKVIQIPKEDGYLLTHWVSSARYMAKKGTVRLCFDPKLKPHLLGLKQHFTQYPLKYVLPMSSPYSIKIFETLRMELRGKKEGKITRTIQELRNILDLEKTNRYKNYKDFRVRIIEPAQKNCEKHSNIGFTFETVKEGRTVTAIIFNVYEVKQYARLLGEPTDIEEQAQIVVQEPADIEETQVVVQEPAKPVQSGQFTIKPLESFKNDTDPEYDKKFSLLTNMGIGLGEASKIANTESLQTILDAIEVLNYMEQTNQIKKSKTGLLLKLIREKASLLSEVDKEKRRLAQAHREKEARADYENHILSKAFEAYRQYRFDNPAIISQWLDEATEEHYQKYFEQYKNNSLLQPPLLPSGELDKVKCKEVSEFQAIALAERRDVFYAEYVRKNFGKGVAKVNGKDTIVNLD
jgi:plasmid replication initiation protein